MFHESNASAQSSFNWQSKTGRPTILPSCFTSNGIRSYFSSGIATRQISELPEFGHLNLSWQKNGRQKDESLMSHFLPPIFLPFKTHPMTPHRPPPRGHGFRFSKCDELILAAGLRLTLWLNAIDFPPLVDRGAVRSLHPLLSSDQLQSPTPANCKLNTRLIAH